MFLLCEYSSECRTVGTRTRGRKNRSAVENVEKTFKTGGSYIASRKCVSSLFLPWEELHNAWIVYLHIHIHSISALIQLAIYYRTNVQYCQKSISIYRTNNCRLILFLYLYLEAHFKRSVISLEENVIYECILFWILHRLIWAWNLRRTCILKINLNLYHRFNILYDMNFQELLLTFHRPVCLVLPLYIVLFT